MLRYIPGVLSPELLKILMEMGHGDEILLADRNFPAVSMAKRLVRCDNIEIGCLLEAMIKFLPLDETVGYNAIFMDVPQELDLVPSVWGKYKEILKGNQDKYFEPIKLNKPEFYARSSAAFAIVITGAKERFANLIVRKGILKADESY